MDSRRTRRDVMSVAAGLGLVLAGCLDGGANEAGDGNGGNDGDGGRPTYQEWVLAASASSEVDLSELTFVEFDLTAVDAVSESLPDEQAQGLRDAAYADAGQLAEELGTDGIDATFSFRTRGATDGTEPVNCLGLEGTFDVEPVREAIEAETDMAHQRIEEFDVYSGSGSSIALSSAFVVDVSGGVSAEEMASLLERVESGDFESDDGGDGDGNSVDFETLVSHLDDGATAIGDFRSSMNTADVSGWGGSVAFDDGEATIRLVELYEDAPDDETVADAESDAAEGYGLGAYEDASVDADGRAIVTTARVDTEEYRGIPW
ncbi:hypothetical protein [Haloterrigena alkaliphila]|uniref:Uncharacterized protein n=1 Tax=Haloterrigena alkaliphila TaxID=2816475 RepID=A0A8A2V9P6_9EURY|nr:hypothetical protein [Haloterrigena alkaliphila]QSW98673.1 hypothetical protein J0X25_14940 [Haloterrigena alkaliphila]